MKTLIFILLLLLPFSLFAESGKDYIRKGNKQYKAKKFNEAEISYRKSLETEGKNYKGTFNLGNALYKQKNFEDASAQFLEMTTKNLAQEDKAKSYHNLGNTYLQGNKIQESIEAYKKALAYNPNDQDTKYNLAYAQWMLKNQQQQQQKNKDKNQKDQNKQDQNQQNKDQQKQNQKNKQEQQSQQQQQQQQQQQAQQQQAEKKKISKKDAERILQALNSKEREVQKKLLLQKRQRAKYSKNW